MTWFPAFPPSQRLIRTLAAAVVAASAPALATAQTSAKQRPKDDPNAPSTVRAEQMTGRPDREIFLKNDVEIVRGQTTVNADQATYHVVEDEVEASGNIRMKRFGDTYTGDELKLKVDTGVGFVTNPTYHLEMNNARGSADRIDFLAQDQATVYDGSYSTCEAPNPDWYLKSSKLDLDSGRDIGTAHRSVVYFKGVPILAAPTMTFPLSGDRVSGFLPPTIGSTNRGGLDVTVPYYWNIAPNRDLTLYPKIISKRGIQLGAEGRYLGETYSGTTRLEYLQHDRETGTDRYSITSTHNQVLAPGLAYGWNLNVASDDEYPTDFARTITVATQRLLPREMYMSYGSTYWSTVGRLSNYQVLQDPLAPIGRPYDRLPQLNFFSGRQDVAGFDWNFDAELTRFYHPDLVRGDRFFINPRIAYPIITQGFFLTPKLSFHATEYSLQDQAPGVPSNITRALPTFSVDSGLVFERDSSFFGQNMTQTLEPRLFYVRTPFRDQSLIPNFDSAEADLSFTQLFSENRFLGNDRISDANQLTAALVSRYLEPTGAERLRLAIGQRYYFSEQRVTLGEARNESHSDLLLSAYGQISNAFSIDGNLQYSQSLRSVRRADYGVRWSPAPRKVLNLQYRRDVPNLLEQVDLSAQWPIANRWYGVGRVNYSLPDRKVAEGLAGFEYKAECWVFRLVSQRVPTATGKATSSLFFQLELNGLTRLGSNPMEALRRNIPGYQLVNDAKK